MLKLENVSKFYYNKGIIASGFTKVNLELKIGEFVAIIGESGSGKSTLLNVISGLDSYEEGEMYVNGKETSHYQEKDFEEYRRKYIANIFQEFNLINSYTVYQNVELVLLLNGYKKHKVKKKILDIIDKVGLTKFKNTKVSKLSGGQKQRVAIARAMVKDTPIIVADEPTGNLDSESAKEIIELLKKVAKDKLVVVVTHNIEQIEDVATRIIKMHDGRIVQNIEKKKIKEEPEITESKYHNITLFNKYRLGVRNTFNIASKFLLLFAVFFFLSASILTEYASFQMSEANTADEGYSIAFRDLSENRIIINKKDRTYFTNDDYEKIKQLPNIDYIVEDDIFIDEQVPIYKDDMSLYGNLLDINNFRGDINYGRMPENDSEIIVRINEEHFYITNRLEELLNKTFSLQGIGGNYNNESTKDLIVVGVQTYKNAGHYDCEFYVSKNLLNELRNDVNKSYSNIKVLLNNKYVQYTVEPNDNVPEGKAIVDDEFKYQFRYNRIRNQPIEISLNNIYYEEVLNLSISNTYTKSNLKRLLGLNEYDSNRHKIFVNTEDYNKLFNKPSYQSSVYVKDVETIDETMNDLQNLGINPKKVTDFKVNQGEASLRIIKIIKVIVTIILIIVGCILVKNPPIFVEIFHHEQNDYYYLSEVVACGFEMVLDKIYSFVIIFEGIIVLIASNVLNLKK